MNKIFLTGILVKIPSITTEMTNLDIEENKTIRNLLTDGDFKPTDKPSSLGLHYMLLKI